MGDASKILPTAKNPIESTFSLNMKNRCDVTFIKSWAGSEAELEPFKEWFEIHGQKPDADASGKVVALNDDVEMQVGSFSMVRGTESTTDFDYFQFMMGVLGSRVVRLTKDFFVDYKNLVGNRKFNCGVEWHSKTESRGFTKSGCGSSRENVLIVKTWVDTTLVQDVDSSDDESEPAAPRSIGGLFSAFFGRKS